MSGAQIADNWRNFSPVSAVDIYWSQLPRLIYAESFFELDAFRRKIFPAWELDWAKIRAGKNERDARRLPACAGADRGQQRRNRARRALRIRTAHRGSAN
jgi:hypothetical protein